MSKVAIYGSCVTRDAFEMASHAHTVVAYHARSSFISQCAPALPFDDADLGTTLKPWDRRMVAADLEKSVVERLVASQPDLVVIDLIDERFALAMVDDSAVTMSPAARATPFVIARTAGAPLLLPTDRARTGRFIAAAQRFMETLCERIPAERVLLHRAMYASAVASGPSPSSRERRHHRKMNRALERWYDAVVAASGCHQFRAPAEAHVADPGHKWGASPFHYAPSYYEELIAAIDAVTSGAPTGRAGT